MGRGSRLRLRRYGPAKEYRSPPAGLLLLGQRLNLWRGRRSRPGWCVLEQGGGLASVGARSTATAARKTPWRGSGSSVVPPPASRSYVLARSARCGRSTLTPDPGRTARDGGRRAQGALRRHRRPRSWGCHRSGVRDTAPSTGGGDTGKRTTVTGPDRAAHRCSSARSCAARRRRRAGELWMATASSWWSASGRHQRITRA